MKEINLQGVTLTKYEHIDEMPVNLFNNANEYALLDAEVGNTPADINRHLGKLTTLLKGKDNQELIVEEVKNLRRCYAAILDHNNHIGLQFCCYIKEIDGKPLPDHGHETLRRVLSRLSDAGLTMGVVREEMDESKKKSAWSWRRPFRSDSPDHRSPPSTDTATE